MEDSGGRGDAREARDRCLSAIVGAGDFETQRSLWRAALRFHERVREAAGEKSAASLHTREGARSRCNDRAVFEV